MKLVVFGLSITSSWGNGHATTYRSLLRAFAARGHQVDFIERDVEWYRTHRDLPAPTFATVHLYDDWHRESAALLKLAASADAVIVGSYFPDAIVATEALLAQGSKPLFYDIDTPITLAALRASGHIAYLDAALVPHYAAYLSFTGGPVLAELQQRFGSPRAIAFYCSVDPQLYTRTSPRAEYTADISYLGTYAADRQPALDRLLNGTARRLQTARFLVAGPQYPPALAWPDNVKRLDHVAPADHPAFYSSARFTLNLTRADMVAVGYSPSVRLFEASACGAAILSDTWAGIDEFLTPGESILLPTSASDVAGMLTGVTDEQRLRVGERAREQILAHHTSSHRAEQLEQVIGSIG